MAEESSVGSFDESGIRDLSHSSPMNAQPEDSSKGSLTFKMETIQETSQPSELYFGFIGCGKMGSAMIKRLIDSNHKIIISNRTIEKCQELQKNYKNKVEVAETPAEVTEAADVVFSCVSNDQAAKDVLWNPSGVLSVMKRGKSLVEMSGIDSQLSQSIAEAIAASGGRYLEVRFRGSRPNAEAGTLTVLAAGDRSLYDDCSTPFSAFASKKMFLGEVGKASTINTFVNAHLATILCATSEHVGRLWNQFEETNSNKQDFLKKLDNVIPINYYATPLMSVVDIRKDVYRALAKANQLDLKTPMLSSVMAQLNNCLSAGNGSDNVDSILFSYITERDTL